MHTLTVKQYLEHLQVRHQYSSSVPVYADHLPASNAMMSLRSKRIESFVLNPYVSRTVHCLFYCIRPNSAYAMDLHNTK